MTRNEVSRNGVILHADIYDLIAGTYSREEGGVVVSTRPLTADEIAALTPPPVVPTAEERLAAAAAALAALDSIEAPVLATEVVEILADVRTALEG